MKIKSFFRNSGIFGSENGSSGLGSLTSESSKSLEKNPPENSKSTPIPDKTVTFSPNVIIDCNSGESEKSDSTEEIEEITEVDIEKDNPREMEDSFEDFDKLSWSHFRVEFVSFMKN